MKQYKSIILSTILFLPAMADSSIHGQTGSTIINQTDSVQINFRQSKWDLDLSITGNALALDGFDHKLDTVINDSVFKLRHISIYGGASPEGSVDFNKFLSEHRAATLFGWFDKYNRLLDLDKSFIFYGRDWEGVLNLAEKDRNVPFKDETLSLLRTVVREKRALNGEEPGHSLERVKGLRNGIPYKYLYANIFPKVRASKVVIEYERVLASGIREQVDTIFKRDTIYVERITEIRDTIYIDNCEKIQRKNRKRQ